AGDARCLGSRRSKLRSQSAECHSSGSDGRSRNGGGSAAADAEVATQVETRSQDVGWTVTSDGIECSADRVVGPTEMRTPIGLVGPVGVLCVHRVYERFKSFVPT